MIPATNTMTAFDTLPGEETEFSIGDPRWVMRSTADLYSNRELAVAREYSTNARDAMVEAGKADQPIIVTLPTKMNPYFKVKDTGIGMSESAMKGTYTQFGSSTKRDSNDFNGMLGFGSKSAIAYTNTFTITAVKDGIKTVGVITRKPDFSVVLKVVMTSKTTEENGVEVSVPVHNPEEFAVKARDFYRFWMPGTVLVNGQEPELAVGTKIDDNLYYSLGDKSYVVMGNVGYRVTNAEALFSGGLPRSGLAFVAFVPNGAVEFTPSREDLKYTDLTKNTLREIASNFEAKIKARAFKEISEAATASAAYDLWVTWENRLGVNALKDASFNGEKFVRQVNILGHKYSPNSSYRSNTHRINSFYLSDRNTVLIVHKFDKNLASTHKAGARHYAAANNFRASQIIFTDSEFSSPWIHSYRVVTWEEIKATLPKKPRSSYSTGTGRIPGTFDYFTRSGKKIEQDLPTTGNLYYISAQNKNWDVAQALNLLNDDGAVVILAKNRIPKFLRENPKVKEFGEYVRSEINFDGPSLVSEQGKRALEMGTNTIKWANALDLDKVDDPRFKEVRDLVAPDSKHLVEYKKHKALADIVSPGSFVTAGVRRWDNSLMKDYPLMNSFVTWNFPEDLYVYLNAKYAEIKKGKK